jgi:hypothetical protein
MVGVPTSSNSTPGKGHLELAVNIEGHMIELHAHASAAAGLLLHRMKEIVLAPIRIGDVVADGPAGGLAAIDPGADRDRLVRRRQCLPPLHSPNGVEIVRANALQDAELAGAAILSGDALRPLRRHGAGMARIQLDELPRRTGFHYHRAPHAEEAVQDIAVPVPGHSEFMQPIRPKHAFRPVWQTKWGYVIRLKRQQTTKATPNTTP